MPSPRSTADHLRADGAPKRILALDGGGLRGIVSLAFLERIERLLAERHGRPDLRLHDYFDLIAGTSTGAIIAAALALGMSVAEIREHYRTLGRRVFRKSFFRRGVVRALYDEAELVRQLKRIFGAGTTLASPELRTGLLVVTKRLDTGSPWPLGNNPGGAFFGAAEEGVIANGDYPLWAVVRASTAAPRYFDSQAIVVARERGKKPVTGQFVDGGVSPFNNPSLQALMYATLSGYRVGWPTGAERLLLVSVGTGARDPSLDPSRITAGQALQSLVALMDDCGALVETLMQWLSASPTARAIDRELGDLGGDLLAGAPLLTYLRYNLSLDPANVHRLDPALPDRRIASLSAMDAPENLELLHALGERAAGEQVEAAHFPAGFDLAPPAQSVR